MRSRIGWAASSRGLLRLIAVLLAGVVALGCGFGSSSSTTTTTIAASSTTTTTTTIAASSTTTAPLPQCSTGVLNASASSGGIAAGSALEILSLTNSGPSKCAVGGYVNLAFFGSSGASGAGAGPRLSVTVNETGATAGSVTLAPQSAAEVSLRYSDEPVGGAGCDTVASIELSLPGSPETLAFPVSLTLCGGSVEISPLAASGAQSP